MTRILIVCQARMQSTRLPGKVLLPLAGRPLIVRIAERLRRSRLATTTVVATTTGPADDHLVDLCRSMGLDVFRGHATDLLDRHLQAADTYGADVVVKIPSDCPLIDPAIIDAVLATFLDMGRSVDYVSNLHPATFPDGNDVEVMWTDVLRSAHRHARRPFEREHTTPWMWNDNADVRCANVVLPGGRDYSMTHRWTIDYPEDYMFIRAVYDELYRKNPCFGYDDVMNLVECRPEIAGLNQHLAGVNWYRHHLDELVTIGEDCTRHHPPSSAA